MTSHRRVPAVVAVVVAVGLILLGLPLGLALTGQARGSWSVRLALHYDKPLPRGRGGAWIACGATSEVATLRVKSSAGGAAAPDRFEAGPAAARLVYVDLCRLAADDTQASGASAGCPNTIGPDLSGVFFSPQGGAAARFSVRTTGCAAVRLLLPGLPAVTSVAIGGRGGPDYQRFLSDLAAQVTGPIPLSS